MSKDKKLLLQTIKNQIEETNAVYTKATDAEKRVMIAKDLILRIELEQLSATGGYFLTIKDKDEIDGDDSIQTLLNETNISCEVCGKGGFFMSFIGRENNLNGCELKEGVLDKISHSLTDDFFKEKLTSIFPRKMLDMIEIAYEGIGFSWNSINPWSNEYTNCLNFNDAYLSRNDHEFDDDVNKNDLLIAIANNIIHHKGDFKPETL